MRHRQGAQRKRLKAGRVRVISRQAEAEERITNTSLTLPLAISAFFDTNVPSIGSPTFPVSHHRKFTSGVRPRLAALTVQSGTEGQPRGHNVHCAKDLYSEANNDNNDTRRMGR